jgi:ATP-binding cassette, subfamily C, bacterial
MSKLFPSDWRGNTWLEDAAKPTYPIFITAIIFSFFINLLMFVSPLYMLQIYDRVVSSRSETTLVALTILAAVLLAVYASLEALRARILVRAGLAFDEKIAGSVFEAIHKGNIKMPQGGHSQCLRDLDVVREFLTGSGLIALCDAPWFPIFVAACFLLHPWFGVIAILGSALTLGLTIANDLATKKELMSASLANSRATQSAQAVFRNTEVLQAMGMVEPLKRMWMEQHDSVLASQATASDRAGVIIALTKFSRVLLQTIVLGTGAYLVIHRDLSAGGIVAGSILIGRAMQPIELAVANWKGFIAARAAYGRLRNLFIAAGSDSPRLSLPRPNGAVQLSGVVAGAPGQSRSIILKGVSLEIAPGEVIGVVGPSAAGKSSLARVLVGVWPIVQGAVRLDGSELDHWDPQQLGHFIGYLPQDVELFAGSVAQNIARFRDGSSSLILEAAKLAGCHELIQQLSEGYNTQLGEGGHTLSGGQRQRIALARAIYGQPSFVVLDEPNANLDAAGEEALLHAVQKLKELKTSVVIISHKVNILAVVDKILVMADGAVQLYGPRDAVLQRLNSPNPMQGQQKPMSPSRASTS